MIHLKNILIEFGFQSVPNFFKSLLRTESTSWLVWFSSLGTMASEHFGLNITSLVVLIIVMFCELFLGIASSVKRKQKINAIKFNRFGLKIFIYFLLLLVLQTFKAQYTEGLTYNIYSTLHSFVLLYIIGVYLISILENTAFLLGGKSAKEISNLVDFIKARFIKEKLFKQDDTNEKSNKNTPEKTAQGQESST